ncbi:MAG: helicase [Desulfobulbus propionicus]|nr:MAG: helicase [Desulfobulbus propionicus]
MQPGNNPPKRPGIGKTIPGEVTLVMDRECCLHGAPPELTKAISSALTIDNPKYTAAKRYGRWIGKQLKPTLTFFTNKGNTLCFPRGYGNHAVLKCRALTGRSPRIIDKRRLLEPLAVTFQGTLRPYQQRAVEAVCNHSFGVLEAGTGSGKTVMALDIIARRRQPTVIIVHSKELLMQWKERICQFLDVEAGQAGGGIVAIKPITVAIVNTARKHLDTLPQQFGHLVVDECHRVPASLFTDVVSAFDCHYMLGLSATAFRREDGMTKLIYTYMGDRVHKVDGGALAASGAVVVPELVQRPTSFSYRYRGEYSKLIKALARDKERNTQIAADIAELVKQGNEGTILLVSDRVAHCAVLVDQLQPSSVRAELLTGQVGKEQREQIVQDVLDGKVDVLASTIQLIGEGFDCPGLTTLVLATPIKFEGRLLQVVGRIMRPAPGKKALVLDYVDERIGLLARSAAKRCELFEKWSQ